jgi:NAD(P)-dependent dehydrogenase (short-subunit alcohol dehydrogenase family)
VNDLQPVASRINAPLLAVAAVAAAAAAAALRSSRQWSFADRVVVITGGSRGLGLALARQVARERGYVILLARTESQLLRARDDIRGRGGRADIFKCDVTDPAQVRATIDRVVSLTGRIDVLVNNAGIIQMMPFEHAQDSDFEASLRTHFWGPLHLIRAALPHIPRGGRIVNISSIGGRVSVPHLVPYSVGKFALTALSDALGAELAPHGISVTTISPGLMRTGSHRNVVLRGHHRQEAQWFALSASTSATSMNVNRAARQILQACRTRQSRATIGWQARSLELADRLAPNALSRAMSLVVRYLLPAPSTDDAAERARLSRDLDLGWVTSLFPTGAAADFNQPLALGERIR